ncbi:MAG: serine/threonine protein kinase, partial [Sandaracinaceae bacterium]|nr:serine/threonine protein kinase [Sandaracinaceae bacterium]
MKDVGVKELAETLADLSEHKKPAPAPSPPPASSPPASSPAASSPAASSPAAADALLGRLLDDRYRVLGLLGEGGMGLVYDAKHEILGTPLAIKVLRKDASGDEEAVERLKREAQAASAIGHEHIVDVRDFGRLADGSVYVVMELLDGVDLYRVVREGPLPIDRLRHIAIQICEALGAAHERGIVHRDLKPENVLLIARRGDPDFVKVLDFGIAKVQNASLKLTAAGRVMGTPEYMSPEQCSGGAVDARADVYSLGVMLYEMATGRLPFADRDLVELVRKQIQQPPLAPSVVRPDLDIPLPLEAIILRCLAKKPEERLQSMADVAEALRELKMPAPLPPAAREPHELTTAQARPTPRAIAAPASRRGWIVASIIAILAVAGAALWALSPPGREPPSVPLAASGGEPVAGPPRRVEVERGGDGTA